LHIFVYKHKDVIDYGKYWCTVNKHIDTYKYTCDILSPYNGQTYTRSNKQIAGSDECSPNGYCLYKAEVVIQHHLYTKT